jgi:4-hydroxybenzoate polyprenyltransferase/phosphoserine phosphatase
VAEGQLRVLVLDLDGTLLGVDSLWELFFKAISQGRLAPLFWLFCGRLRFKRKLAETTELNLDLLPWNQKVIKLARDHRENGGEVWLATAANQAMARKVTEYFDFFSGYMASDMMVNLKSRAKARTLVERFGEGGFIYAGDSRADILVWQVAGEAVVVGGKNKVRLAKPVSGKVITIEPVGTKIPSLGVVLELARPSGWLRNLFLLLPLVLSLSIQLESVLVMLVPFLVFGLFSSAGNTLDQLLSLEQDRQKPQLVGQTLAAGKLELSRAGYIFLGLILAGLVLLLATSQRFSIPALVFLFLVLLDVFKFKRQLALSLAVAAALPVTQLVAAYQVLALPVPPVTMGLCLCFFIFLSLVEGLSLVAAATSDAPVTLIGGFSLPKEQIKKILSFSAGFLILVVVGFMVIYSIMISGKGWAFEAPLWLIVFSPFLAFFGNRLIIKAKNGELKKEPFMFMLTDPLSWAGFFVGLWLYYISGPVAQG